MAEGDYRAAAQGRVAAAALLNVLFDRNDENGDNQVYPCDFSEAEWRAVLMEMYDSKRPDLLCIQETCRPL